MPLAYLDRHPELSCRQRRHCHCTHNIAGVRCASGVNPANKSGRGSSNNDTRNARDFQCYFRLIVNFSF